MLFVNPQLSKGLESTVMESTTQQEYRIAPALRRSCWFAIIGSVMLAIVFFCVARFVQNRGPVDIAVGLIPFALLTGAMVFPLRWKLRISPNGLARRILVRWDFWAWEVLASGRIRKLHPHTLHDPDRQWWRSKLRLSYMASADIQDVISVVNRHYQLVSLADVTGVGRKRKQI